MFFYFFYGHRLQFGWATAGHIWQQSALAEQVEHIGVETKFGWVVVCQTQQENNINPAMASHPG